MTKRTILIAPDPKLKAKAKPVAKVDAAVKKLADDMLETMYAGNGIGLAAVQIGVPQRVVVMDLDQKTGKKPRVFVNPKIVAASQETAEAEEGCLSLPDIWEKVTRPAKVTCEYLDRDGEARSVDADGMFAVCLQHEIDHLDGTLFVDHLSRLKRSMALKKLAKAQKEKEKA